MAAQGLSLLAGGDLSILGVFEIFEMIFTNFSDISLKFLRTAEKSPISPTFLPDLACQHRFYFTTLKDFRNIRHFFAETPKMTGEAKALHPHHLQPGCRAAEIPLHQKHLQHLQHPQHPRPSFNFPLHISSLRITILSVNKHRLTDIRSVKTQGV